VELIKTPGQFSVRGLFVLTTAAAVLFAVLRLPFDTGLKIVIAYLALILYYRWALAARVRPPWKQVVPAILGPGSYLPVMLWMIFRLGWPRPFFLTCVYGFVLLLLVLLISLNGWHVLRRSQAEAKNSSQLA